MKSVELTFYSGFHSSLAEFSHALWNFSRTALSTALLLTTTMLFSTFVLNPVLHFKMLRVRQPNRVGHDVRQAAQAQLREENIVVDEVAR